MISRDALRAFAESQHWRAVSWLAEPGVTGHPWRFSGRTDLAGGDERLWTEFLRAATDADLESAWAALEEVIR